MPENLAEHTKPELLELAEALGIDGKSSKTKPQLVDSIRRATKKHG